MNGNTDQAHSPISSRDQDGLAAKFARTYPWRKTLPVRSGHRATVDRSEELAHIASDDRLFLKARSGDRHAFDELCRRHSPLVKRRIFAIVRNREDAEDALQETLLRAYTHLDTFRHACKFSTWLVSIGINAALMLLRKRKTRKEQHIDLRCEESGEREGAEYADLSLDPERLHARSEIVLVVRREVERLRPTLRSMIEHYYEDECSLEKSAKALNISLSTAKARLMRGKQKLRRHLSRCGVSDSRI
jgi:RNA polymerase sigma-70 factor (ECF subfamily)